ncbi:M20 family metallo-hydrolase [Thalassorhabdus alkalitolerans]|uniref:M20 family metallo-hydrolase n=1 Tax=Thalassorhabdus alkalitolerans TaxID=2282697 RepID=A0ABW0YGD2_9BACI
MQINKGRLKGTFEELSKVGKIEETGVCRPALSSLDKEASLLVAGWMEEAGMNTRFDHFGNLIGRFEGKNPDAPILMVGSHIDSQPNGGRFDGTAGVLSALEAVTVMNETGVKPYRPIEVIAFSDEEGWRFNKGLFGSRGIIGELEEGELGRKDKDGITREEALRAYGCQPERFAESEYDRKHIHSFLELHIEQGPVLEEKGVPVGVVKGISGPLWATLKLKGTAGHAGSVPMKLRQDALAGAAEVITALNSIVQDDPDQVTVGTVGSLEVSPNSRNVIADEVVLTIDLRDIDKAQREKCEEKLRRRIEEICEKHNLTYELREDFKNEPSYCSDWIKEIIHEACKTTMDTDAPEVMSGPFHDALTMSKVCDYGMIFVRCKKGISHNPAEFASFDDLAAGAEVLYQSMLQMVKKEVKGENLVKQ